MRHLLTSTAAISMLALAAPALAQDKGKVDVVAAGPMALDQWNYDELYQQGSWTAEQLFDADVIGPNGDEIGEVENIIVGKDGMIEAVIAEVGGFWDIGDTHVRVPWSEVDARFEDGEAKVHVPVTEDRVKDYDVFGGDGAIKVVDDDDPATPRGWRATELIDDYVTLKNDERYGWVEDLVFDRQGKLRAVVVDATAGAAGGPYAYPYYGYGYGFRPGSPYYRMPYEQDEMSKLESFDYDRLEAMAEES
jgi:sporulation protein YlmC with PRC-barrel domain